MCQRGFVRTLFPILLLSHMESHVLLLVCDPGLVPALRCRVLQSATHVAGTGRLNGEPCAGLHPDKGEVTQGDSIVSVGVCPGECAYTWAGRSAAPQPPSWAFPQALLTLGIRSHYGANGLLGGHCCLSAAVVTSRRTFPGDIRPCPETFFSCHN